MRTLRRICAVGLLVASVPVFGQMINPKFVGNYKDGGSAASTLFTTELELYENGTFRLVTPDPVFTNTRREFENRGRWISRRDTVFLNPDRKPRSKTIQFSEKSTGTKDSVTIRINYFVEYFDDDRLVERERFDFDVLTLCINKKNQYHHLVRQPKTRNCLLSPKVKNQIVIDSTNTIKVPAKQLKKIGVFTYGFDAVEWLEIVDTNTDYIEITLVQPVDQNRMPANRAVIIKGNTAYFYMRNGKIDKSLTPLKRQK